ncbi:MAG: ATP-binding protein [Candidatus Competibacter sp.]|nr:ATP-binding protein [Candidatus Competibacter sp.]MDG4585181.1 ATP-binding protein [Candidatus Competibacter sp.]
MGRLFWKFFFAFWLALLIASGGVGTTVWLHRQTLDDHDRALAGGPRTAFLVNTTAMVFRHGGIEALRGLLEEWSMRQGKAWVYVVDETGRELLGRTVSAETVAQARRLAAGDQTSRIAWLEAAPQHTYLFFIPAASKASSHDSPPPPWIPISIGILASLGFSALLAWYLSKPIRHLRGAFDAVAAGKLETRIGTRMGRRRDEIADLGRDFDRMAQQLQILLGSQRRLLHDVSHELRSPLARLQAAIGLARQQPEKLDASLDRIERESSRLDELVGELLTLSRLEAGMSGAADEEVELVELVAGIADDARFEAEANGRRLRFSGEGQVIVKVRAELLHRAFENVIRNAVKFTDEGTTVEVRVERRTALDRFSVTVDDRGSGVPEGDLHAVFEPFFRGGAGVKTTGFGLGLAIARRAIEAHGGSIRARNRPDGGLRVEIVLPAGDTFEGAAGGLLGFYSSGS